MPKLQRYVQKVRKYKGKLKKIITIEGQEKNSYLFVLIVGDAGVGRVRCVYFTKHFFERYAERMNLRTEGNITIKEFTVQDGFFFIVNEDDIDQEVSRIICK